MRLNEPTHRIRPTRRIADEAGFSMIVVLMVLLASAMFVAAAYAAVQGDLPLSGDSRDRKPTYAAAEAGLNYYQFQLNRDNDYWLRCADVGDPVGQPYDGTGERAWRNVPGSEAQYTIELLPANGAAACDPDDPTSMLDADSGTFRIRVTGRPRTGDELHRSLVASFKRTSFLDFLYFTNYETLDPAAYPAGDVEEAEEECGDKPRASRDDDCAEIVFFDDDRVNGPLHTNDTLLTCGRPTFGRNAQDRVTVAGPAPGREVLEGCADVEPNFMSPFKHGGDGVQSVDMPPTNDELQALTDPDYVFVGRTDIQLRAATDDMVVTNALENGGVPTAMPLPDNGVVYVDNGTGVCSSQPPPTADYAESPSCGNLYVSGDYATSLTLAAKNDIVIRPLGGNDGNVLRANDTAVLGLIAENFVRVYHPRRTGCENGTGSMEDVQIDAAILTLQHSFIVDNHRCGDPLGTLLVRGAIAQNYRGPVGTFNRAENEAVSGYLKDYWYDDRLRYRTPPYFLQPESASWNVARSNEQVPAN